MKKHVKIVIVVLAILFILASVLVAVNWGSIVKGNEAQEQRTITVVKNGETIHVFTEAEILSVRSSKFEAIIRSGGERPRSAVYTGVEIRDLLSAFDIGLDDGTELLVKGADAYLASVREDELEAAENVYIVYEIDGKILLPRAEGGEGPYQLIIKYDYYSLRWCKYVSEIEIK